MENVIRPRPLALVALLIAALATLATASTTIAPAAMAPALVVLLVALAALVVTSAAIASPTAPAFTAWPLGSASAPRPPRPKTRVRAFGLGGEHRVDRERALRRELATENRATLRWTASGSPHGSGGGPTDNWVTPNGTGPRHGDFTWVWEDGDTWSWRGDAMRGVGGSFPEDEEPGFWARSRDGLVCGFAPGSGACAFSREQAAHAREALNNPTFENALPYAIMVGTPKGPTRPILKLDAPRTGVPASGPGISAAEQRAVNALGDAHGCWTPGCGARVPGTKARPGRPQGNWVGDHQLPNSLTAPGARQFLVPHCVGCSREQGLFLARMVNWFNGANE